MRLAPLLLALALAGCTSPPSFADRCAGYGFQPGTEAFAQCLMTLDVEADRAMKAALRSLADTPAPMPVTPVTTIYVPPAYLPPLTRQRF